MGQRSREWSREWGDGSARFARQSLTKVLARPELWSTALRQGARMCPSGWWRRPPFLPLPDREYLRFRLETQYGDGGPNDSSTRDPADLVTYLEWCRAQEQELRRQRHHPRR